MVEETAFKVPPSLSPRTPGISRECDQSGDECQLSAGHWLDPHTTPVSSGHLMLSPVNVCQPQFESKPLLDRHIALYFCIIQCLHTSIASMQRFLLKNTLPQKGVTL